MAIGDQQIVGLPPMECWELPDRTVYLHKMRGNERVFIEVMKHNGRLTVYTDNRNYRETPFEDLYEAVAWAEKTNPYRATR